MKIFCGICCWSFVSVHKSEKILTDLFSVVLLEVDADVIGRTIPGPGRGVDVMGDLEDLVVAADWARE